MMGLYSQLRDQLDSLVDGLSSELGRSIVISDRLQRLISYSAGERDADSIRIRTILERASPVEMRQFVSTLGIDSSARPIRAPANADLGSAARVCVPIRRDEHLLGYIWLIDPLEDLRDCDLNKVENCAHLAADIIVRNDQLNDQLRARERELLEALLADDPAVRAAACVAVRGGGGVFQAETYVRAIAVMASVGGGTRRHISDLVDDVTMLARQLWPPRRLLSVARPDHCVLLVACGSHDDERVTTLAKHLRGATPGTSDLEVGAVGIGGLRALDGARETYRDALRAAAVAGSVAEFRGVAAWDSLGGIYRVLSAIPADQTEIDPMVRLLLDADTDGSLVLTLETYLGLGCDVRSTSARLFLHRTSLYYRLRKIEGIVGASLKDGDVRLSLQLGLKLARMSGAVPN